MFSTHIHTHIIMFNTHTHTHTSLCSTLTHTHHYVPNGTHTRVTVMVKKRVKWSVLRVRVSGPEVRGQGSPPLGLQVLQLVSQGEL